jgi:hypothetical protein
MISCCYCRLRFDVTPINAVVHADGVASLYPLGGPVPWICPRCELSFPDIYRAMHAPIREHAGDA